MSIAREVEKMAEDLGPDHKRSIGQAAKELKVETHVIRFWEENFPQIKPEIGSGKRRYYYNKQLKILKRIKRFLYEEGYSIAGLQKLLKKRKHDGYKEEDLDVILEGSAGSAENSTEKNFEVEDFIAPETSVKPGDAIDPQAKIMNFVNLKIPQIDPKVQREIAEAVKNIRKNLQKLINL
jgi:DNA-binding transcriptional MerR regulator